MTRSSFTVPVTKPYKAVVAAVGTTLTVASTAWAAIELAAGDDAISLEEVSSVGSTLIAAGMTVYGVWKKRNPPVTPGQVADIETERY